MLIYLLRRAYVHETLALHIRLDVRVAISRRKTRTSGPQPYVGTRNRNKWACVRFVARRFQGLRDPGRAPPRACASCIRQTHTGARSVCAKVGWPVQWAEGASIFEILLLIVHGVAIILFLVLTTPPDCCPYNVPIYIKFCSSDGVTFLTYALYLPVSTSKIILLFIE